MIIKQININDVLLWKKDAEKCGLTFCPKTLLFGAFENEKIVGFTGILFYSNKAVFKNHYVPVENRGNGIFRVMFDFSLSYVLNKNIKVVEANCTKMSVKQYLKRGFKIIKEYSSGFVKVRHNNIIECI